MLRRHRQSLQRAAAAVLLLSTPTLAFAQLPTLVKVIDIGCESCGGAAQFAQILDVSANDSGGVLVTGTEAPMVRMFDRAGRSLWTAGSTGMGPGEFRQPIRGMLGPGVVQVLDMSQRRVTRLGSDGRYLSSARLTGFPAAVSARGRSGTFVVLIDNFREGRSLQRWTPQDSGGTATPVPPAAAPPPPGTIVFPSIAVAPDGSVALVRDGTVYSLERVTADGAVVPLASRDVPRVRRTEAELAALERVRDRARAKAASERGARPAPAVAPRPGGDPDLKPHVAIDGLRYDDSGRLWVRTMRGNEGVTIFDLFGANGRYVGEVRVPAEVGAFSLAGRFLAASVVTDDGYAVVRLFEVR